MKIETSPVVFRVPDFVDANGIEYTDIEVIVQMECDIRSTANRAETLQRPVKGNANELSRETESFSPWSEASTDTASARLHHASFDRERRAGDTTSVVRTD